MRYSCDVLELKCHGRFATELLTFIATRRKLVNFFFFTFNKLVHFAAADADIFREAKSVAKIFKKFLYSYRKNRSHWVGVVISITGSIQSIRGLLLMLQ